MAPAGKGFVISGIWVGSGHVYGVGFAACQPRALMKFRVDLVPNNARAQGRSDPNEMY